MSNQDLINHLYETISSLQTLYWGTTGMLITVIVLVVGFYSYQQWKFSDDGIKRLKKDFKIDETEKNLDSMQKVINLSLKSLVETDEANKEVKKSTDKLYKLMKENNEKNFAFNILFAAINLENINRKNMKTDILNKIITLKNLLEANKDVDISKNDLLNVLIPLSDSFNYLRELIEKDGRFQGYNNNDKLNNSINYIRNNIRERINNMNIVENDSQIIEEFMNETEKIINY